MTDNERIVAQRGRSAGVATIKDVARLAGVSPSSVSMALSDHPRISAGTKEIVRQAAAQLNYVPNSAGRALRARKVDAVAVVVPHTSHDFFSHPYLVALLEGITQAANEYDLTTILSLSPSKTDEEAAYRRIQRGQRADGVIVSAASASDFHVDQLVAAGFPVVLVGRIPRNPEVVAVGEDDRGGAEQVTAHLLDVHGLRRVAHISGPLNHQSAIDKREGYRDALARHGLAYDERIVVEGDYTEECGYRACAALLDAGDTFDAIFAGNDQMAFGALGALQARGLDAPRDIAIVGFDDIPLAGVMHPQLTTVAAPVIRAGHLALERLCDLIAGRMPEPRQLELPTELVIRRSCGC
jgi:DNA-binding LacI/PurR family transcriptional regulator